MSEAGDHFDPAGLDRRIHLAERAMLRTLDQISVKLDSGGSLMLLCNVLAGQQDRLAELLREGDERDAQ